VFKVPYLQQRSLKDLRAVLVKIHSSIYEVVAPLKAQAWVTPEPVCFADRFTGTEKTVAIGEKWGDLWDCAWFRFTGNVPEDVRGKKLVLLIDVSGEACVFDNDGNPLQGLTNVPSGSEGNPIRPGKRVFELSPDYMPNGNVDIMVEAGCNDLFGRYQGNGELKDAYIAICNENLRSLVWDFEVLLGVAEQLPTTSARRAQIISALNNAVVALRDYSDEEAVIAKAVLYPELAKQANDASLHISAIGHAHIDLAWLWPIRETIRKGARTFSTVLRMMERYPDYVFGASQPQLYAWMKQHYPTLYSCVKQKIVEGRWEPQGAMWVEADTNVSGSEALVRQVLLGKRFFRAEFNKDMRIMWLPDVFGYSGALPQIMKKSGVDYFMTIKLSWSEQNRYPHHTFVWEGIDGSRVLTHMPPEGTYNSNAAPQAVVRIEDEYLDKGVSDRCLMLFGIGDGGGGPGEEHLERLARMKSLAGLCPVTQEPALDFFRKLEKDMARYATWHGELYLEKHRGTYTTQAQSKRFNRKMEIALRELEFACSLAHVYARADYPQEVINEIWQEVLLYQFHDILPGSSIRRVYEESIQRYEHLLKQVRELTAEAYSKVFGRHGLPGTNEVDTLVWVANSLSWSRTEWLRTDGKWHKVTVPALGYMMMNSDAVAAEPVDGLTASTNCMENDKLRVTFNANGDIVSVYDKEHDREALSGVGNQLAVYEDTGNAWDIPIHYAATPPQYFVLNHAEAYVDGPQAVVEHTYHYGQSCLKQKVVLTEGSRRLDFITSVDWRENAKMLRTAFPINVFSREATCEIQFGNIKRPTHANTSWDAAKFEICAHKWIDLSQGDYGVALLNDCKYGHKAHENVLDLNLLRSTSYPDHQADRTVHEFTYALYPHAGDYRSGGVIQAGYELNMPLQPVADAVAGTGLPHTGSFISVDAPNVIVEAIKKAEDSEAIIVRLYECHGMGVRATVGFGFPVRSVQLVNLMEESIEDDAWDPNSMQLSFRPFEIHTLKVNLTREEAHSM
jgi:alpha-mannosidase